MKAWIGPKTMAWTDMSPHTQQGVTNSDHDLGETGGEKDKQLPLDVRISCN